MARAFRRTSRGIEVAFERLEADLLKGLADELVTVVQDGVVTDDPVVARLFPDGYRDDPAAAAELRDMVESDLRTGKMADAQTLGAVSGGTVVLTEDEAEQWLRALNDLRLALGTRLDITEETYDEIVDDPGDDLRQQQLHVYAWLGWLQETLVAALAG